MRVSVYAAAGGVCRGRPPLLATHRGRSRALPGAHRRLDDATLDGQAVYVLETVPEEVRSVYSRIVTYVDQALCLPLRSEFIGRDGSHFANADTLGPVRVLRLGEACLGQIQQRYPRIGAQLYRNLSAIMAERLADFAVRI